LRVGALTWARNDFITWKAYFVYELPPLLLRSVASITRFQKFLLLVGKAFDLLRGTDIASRGTSSMIRKFIVVFEHSITPVTVFRGMALIDVTPTKRLVGSE
jgi:hypothetical protein